MKLNYINKPSLQVTRLKRSSHCFKQALKTFCFASLPSRGGPDSDSGRARFGRFRRFQKSPSLTSFSPLVEVRIDRGEWDTVPVPQTEPGMLTLH